VDDESRVVTKKRRGDMTSKNEKHTSEEKRGRDGKLWPPQRNRKKDDLNHIGRGERKLVQPLSLGRVAFFGGREQIFQTGVRIRSEEKAFCACLFAGKNLSHNFRWGTILEEERRRHGLLRGRLGTERRKKKRERSHTLFFLGGKRF